MPRDAEACDRVLVTVSDHLVVIGGSAGALGPLREIVAELPATFPAPVLVTLHTAPTARSALPALLDAAGPLVARHPRHGEPLEAGTILVAVPDSHLLVYDGEAHLSRGPRQNWHRPAVDALFNSAARWRGPGVVAVVLSGALDDGAAGAAAIAAQDGTVVVQDPAQAQLPSMPTAAAQAVRRAHVTPVEAIAPLLTRLVDEPLRNDAPDADPLLRWQSETVDRGVDDVPGGRERTPAAIGCPECNGGMFEATVPARPHYVCHVGHSWSPETLVAAQRQATEASLYAAAAKLVEEATVLRRVAALETEPRTTVAAVAYERRARDAEQQAAQIQDMLHAAD